MISIEKALELIFANLPERQVEKTHFQSALGRVLAEDLAANRNIPPFHRSAMDGYAVRAADLTKAPARLPLVGEVRAGGGFPGALAAGQVMAVMTGAPVPEGADAVQIVELTERSGDGDYVIFQESVMPGENIRFLGSEASVGEVVLEKGRVIGAAELAVMATFGFTRVKIWRAPSVALLSTGDELVDVEADPRADQIRNSNSFSLAAQLRTMGIESDYLGIVRDDKEDLYIRIEEGLKRDILILTGGVSVGEYDYVKDVFKELGVEVFFTRVAVKPGKPTVFGRSGKTLVFGLPGNPVSTFVTFENFVRPAIGHLCGLARPELPRVRGELSQDMKQVPGRTAFLPAWATHKQEGWKIDPLAWKGSGDIIGFSRANATVIFPGDRNFMGRGESVEAMLLPDFLSRRR